MACGDSNDLSMIAWAGLGVAMQMLCQKSRGSRKLAPMTNDEEDAVGPFGEGRTRMGLFDIFLDVKEELKKSPVRGAGRGERQKSY